MFYQHFVIKFYLWCVSSVQASCSAFLKRLQPDNEAVLAECLDNTSKETEKQIRYSLQGEMPHWSN